MKSTERLESNNLRWAVTHRIRSGADGDDERAIYSAENGGSGATAQWTYMRDTRERYKEDIMARFGGHRHQRPRQQSYPMSAAPTTGPSDYSYS